MGTWRLPDEAGVSLGVTDVYLGVPIATTQLVLEAAGACRFESYSGAPVRPGISCRWEVGREQAYVHHVKMAAPAVRLTLEEGDSMKLVASTSTGIGVV